MTPIIWHSGKGKTIDTVKKKKKSVVSGGGREEQEELRNFRAVKLHHMMDTVTGDTSHYTFV